MRTLGFLIAVSVAVPAATTGFGAQAKPSTVVAVYEGELPCADCSALRTELSLSAAPSESAPSQGTFVAKYMYVGKDFTNVESGEWKLLRGTPDDKNAVVYDLIADKGKRHEYWLQAGSDLRPLDAKRRDQHAPYMLTLRRSLVEPTPPPGAYRPLIMDDVTTDMAASFAIAQQRFKDPDLSLVKIVSAEGQVVAGTNFRFCLDVRRKGQAEQARTVVFQGLNGKMQLTNWTWGPCGGR
jgi:hypothetical protein